MPSAAAIIANYVHAKDGNRPFLLSDVFTPDAGLEIVVKTGTITFPPLSEGLPAITDVVARRFNQTYENIYTFCLAAPPQRSVPHYSCSWLVGMSEKATRAVRVGYGRYDWSFETIAPGLATRLVITVEEMQTLQADCLGPVMGWLSALPYPWCPVELAFEHAPKDETLKPVMQHFQRQDDGLKYSTD